MPPTKKMPTVMRSGHAFSTVPSVHINRSVFDRSHAHKTTFDAGYLIPVYCDEVLPGDTFTLRMTALARLTTPIKPFMDNMYLDSFFFFHHETTHYKSSKKHAQVTHYATKYH